MRDIDRIRHALAGAANNGASIVLATVLGVEGSVYRGVGARMVIWPGGETVGAVSGGCLEADIVARTPDVLDQGRAELVRYDTRASDDVVLGLGLGCQGVIDVLLEPLSGAVLAGAVAFYNRLAAQRDTVVLLTLVRDRDDGRAGDRAVVAPDGELIEGNGRLSAHDDDVVTERLQPATPLVIAGAGSDAIPLCRLAKSLGWHVTIVDHRSAFLTHERFPGADALVRANLADDPAALSGKVAIDDRTAAVIMAHAAAHDRASLHAMLDAGAGYIGVLGPRRRTLELLGERTADGEIPANVHSPVGLDIGAESPEEIALSIVAEISAVVAGRSGGMLRERRAPIHDRARPGTLARDTGIVTERQLP